MKRCLGLLILPVLMMINCSGAGSGNNDKGFKLEPGNVESFSLNANKSFSINIDGESCGPSESCYAVISNLTVNGIDYVGITISDDPNDSSAPYSFYLRMYFVSSSIPSNITLDFANSNHMIKLRRNGSGTADFNAWTSGSIPLTIADQGDGTYLITGAGGNVSVGVSTLTDLTIRAQKYP